MDAPADRRVQETPYLADETIEWAFRSDLPVPGTLFDFGGTLPTSPTSNMPPAVPIIEALPVVPAPAAPVSARDSLLLDLRTDLRYVPLALPISYDSTSNILPNAPSLASIRGAWISRVSMSVIRSTTGVNDACGTR